MAKWSSMPDEVESARTIKMKFLRDNDIVKPNNFRSGSLIWTSTNGNKNSISYSVRTEDAEGVLRLNYVHNEINKRDYEVKLITRKSNLCDGLIWFFVCPNSKKVCRILHLNSGYFLHRTVFNNFYYEQQTKSKKWRLLYSKSFSDAFRDDLYFEMHKKNMKKFYKGKITRTFKRLLVRKRNAENINLENLLKL